MANELATLRRLELLKPEQLETSTEYSEKAEKFLKELGYFGMMEIIRNKNIKNKKEADEYFLFEKCVKAGFKPFTQDSVNRYKAKKLRINFKSTCYTFIGIPTASILGSGLFMFGLTGTFDAFVASFGILCGGVLGAMVAGSISDKVAEYKWIKVPLRKYSEPIPTPILEKALKLKEELSKGESGNQFLVESFVKMEKSKTIFDPFLIVEYGSARFYVAVWEEPEFDARYE